MVEMILERKHNILNNGDNIYGGGAEGDSGRVEDSEGEL